MNCLSWNIRGLRSQSKISEVRSWITQKKLNWVGLIETKTVGCSRVLVNKLWDNPNIEFVSCDASTTMGGGLILLWNSESFMMTSHFKGKNWIIVEGLVVKEDWRTSLGLIYGSCQAEDRRIMYEELNRVIQSINSPL